MSAKLLEAKQALFSSQEKRFERHKLGIGNKTNMKIQLVHIMQG